MMIFTNLNIETKTLRISSLILTFIGIVFILASNYVGNIAIRIAMIVIFMLSLFNFKISYPFSSTTDKMYMVLSMCGTLLVFIKPQFTMFIIGIVMLILSLPIIYKAIKNKDYSDKIMITLSSLGTLFSIYCIINSRAALNTVVIVIGIAFVILGCLILFETFDINRKSNKFVKYNHMSLDNDDEYRFENAEEVEK
ncbi:uncharacterized membrane protein HdeD (DUF308 family) [Sedimentibacter acidaminivorans]|jgi:uncharacterized membrane protein HdeD (DUF308 family)|uniref:Uncharacterized membrane protein HdeD (DUF308 family) n=1 Tax=Sedimentibacter acidaminivorans TaxID=913099 RepID=A0ABS4GF82_9FIRM|nr:hypothetical protein [Sedimentibacter acidaminivorans]MBP1926360.1 uncharacterized membrane protein HdeD (DUF308 family) [Sedimentibacter acidaminivorans]